MDELESKGIRYTRVMTKDDRPSSAIGRGWAKTFGVSSEEELEAKLSGTGQTIKWLNEEDVAVPGVDPRFIVERRPLRHYSATLPGVRTAEELEEEGEEGAQEITTRKRKKLFFNQILAAYLGWRDELNHPGRAVVFGDGGAMPEEAMEAMARIFQEESVAVPWRHGDVMLLDNLQVMHARQSFVNGAVPRRVLASLTGDPRSSRTPTRTRTMSMSMSRSVEGAIGAAVTMAATATEDVAGRRWKPRAKIKIKATASRGVAGPSSSATSAGGTSAVRISNRLRRAGLPLLRAVCW